jgi:hypothetical protein
MSPRAVTIGLATAMQESRLRNLDYGDRDSLGMFQQRPSQGWGTEDQVMDPLYAAGVFFSRLAEVPGFEDMPITEAAQAVQHSGFPDAYAAHETMARSFASALTGHSPGAMTCVFRPATDSGSVDEFLAAQAAEWGEVESLVVEGLGTEAGGRGILLTLGSPEAAWAHAEWAVAKAGDLSIESVQVDGQVWERADGAWEPVTATRAPARGGGPGPNLVLITRA